jgi:endonuclease/exonuclease/phosphatase (EEP) superfamily protein YafD
MVLPRAIPAADAPAPDAPGGRTLTVLSFNTYEGKADVAAVAAEIRAANPDLVALPEASGRFTDKLAPLVPDYRFAPSQERGRDVEGVTAASRADLGEATVDVDHSTTFPSVQLTLAGVRFVAFHSVAPKPGDTRGWGTDLTTLDRWCANRAIGPAILAGDFNATLDHSVFRESIAGCADAGDRTGQGLVGTWPTWAPRWLGPQIDHVLVTGGITAETLSVVDLPGSDHRAVLTRLRLPA